MTNYEFTKVSPQQLMLQVRYTKDEFPDYWVNLRITDFSEENLHQTASDNAGQAERFWQSISELPQEMIPQESTGVAKTRIYADAPEHDPFNKNLSYEWIETDNAITQTWVITEKSEEEKAEYLNQWRGGLEVTMRQARLALAQQGLLQTVKDAIALIPEPDKAIVSIEWEYSATVERSSQWVATLAPALNLNDEQMDDLFKLAATL
jgi:hypothetical protein